MGSVARASSFDTDDSTRYRLSGAPDVARREGAVVPSIEEVSAVFHLPIDKAAKAIGVGQTWLKHMCREHGIPRWPYRKIQSLQTSIARLTESIADINPKACTDRAEKLRYETVVAQIKQLEEARNALCRGQKCPEETSTTTQVALKAAARRGRKDVLMKTSQFNDKRDGPPEEAPYIHSVRNEESTPVTLSAQLGDRIDIRSEDLKKLNGPKAMKTEPHVHTPQKPEGPCTSVKSPNSDEATFTVLTTTKRARDECTSTADSPRRSRMKGNTQILSPGSYSSGPHADSLHSSQPGPSPCSTSNPPTCSGQALLPFESLSWDGPSGFTPKASRDALGGIFTPRAAGGLTPRNQQIQDSLDRLRASGGPATLPCDEELMCFEDLDTSNFPNSTPGSHLMPGRSPSSGTIKPGRWKITAHPTDGR